MIFLARHGETAFNRDGRLQGHVDSPLTHRGEAQANAMGRLLAGLTSGGRGWRIVASPLGRAQRTAEIIAGQLDGPEIVLEPRLMEVSWGAWDGRLRRELEDSAPRFRSTGWAFDAAAGEDFESICARVSAWLADLPAEPDRRVIAVSHGVTGRVLRGLYAGLGPQGMAALPAPQDAVFQLSAGEIARFDCAALDASPS